MGVQFNRSRPILEANTENLRISIWHESRCQKKSMSIRKIPEYLRFDHMTLIESRYAPESIINLLENSVSAHLSIVVGGQPHAGKTHTTKKPVYMKTIRKSTIEKSILTKNVLSFSWMIRLLTLIL